MVEAAQTELAQQTKERHPQMSGITEVTDAGAQSIIDKVIDKLVRVTVADGRVYLGKLMSVDQTRTVFVQDALELFDRQDEEAYVEHELITSHMVDKVPATQRHFLKLVGNIVVPGRQLVKIELDKRF